MQIRYYTIVWWFKNTIQVFIFKIYYFVQFRLPAEGVAVNNSG